MKMTKKEIAEKQSALVETLLEIERCKKEKTSLEALLDAHFKANAAAYENGVVTSKGILIRKPSYKTIAKPIVEAD